MWKHWKKSSPSANVADWPPASPQRPLLRAGATYGLSNPFLFGGMRELLIDVQHQLFNLGGELSIPGFELLKEEAVLQLDQALATHNAALPRLQEFILPAGTRAAAQAHVCRTVARRAERAVVALGAQEAVREAPRHYLNRLSDLMFVLARVLNRMDGGDDVYWKSARLAQAEQP